MGILSVIGATPNPVREGTTSVTVQVRFTPDPVNAGLGLRSFTYGTIDGTATKGSDFIGFADSKVTFSTADTLPGLTTQQDFFFTIPIIDDAIVENPETFVFQLLTVEGAITGTDRLVITINDNDSPDQPAPLGRGTIRFEFANYVVVEGQAFVEARVIREGGQLGVIQGEVSVQFGTASGDDISTPAQTSIFFGDQDITPKIIRIPIIDDNTPEPTEQFTLVLTERRQGTDQNVGATTNLVVDRSVVQIQDNDGSNNVFPTINLAQSIINVAENAGFVEVPIDVIFPPGGRPATGNYTIEVTAGTATAADFTAITRTFNFDGVNQSFRENIRVPITNDALPEGLESFSVRVASSDGAFVSNATTIVNIIDDDVSASVTVAPTNPSEGTNVTITVTPNGVFEPGEVRTVTINTQDVTARLGQDFRAPTFSTLTFTFDNPNPQTATIEIAADQIPEQQETFQVVTTGTRTINGVTLPLVISGGTQTVTIREEATIRVTAVTPIVTEGLDRFAQVRVERFGDISRDVSAELVTREGTAISGAERDFIALGTQFIRFAPGDSTPRLFNIPIVDNNLIQGPRTFTAELTNPQDGTPPRQVLLIPASISATGAPIPATFGPDPTFVPFAPPTLSPPTTFTINDNDGPNAAAGTAAARGSIQFERASYVVDEGQGFIDIRIQRIGGTSGAVNAEITLPTATGFGVATPGTDFISPAQSAVFFADGVGGFQTIRIPVINDAIVEPTENFVLNLVETRGGQRLTVNSTVVQINDNDSNVSPADLLGAGGFIGDAASGIVNVSEGAGLVTIPVRFSGRALRENLPRPSIRVSTVTGTGEGAATVGEDFVAVTRSIEFSESTVGETVFVSIPLVNDRNIEITESFFVVLEGTGLSLQGPDRLVVNIIDNDGVGDGNVPAVDSLSSPFFSPITARTQTVPIFTPEAINPPAIPTDFSDTLLGTNDPEAIAGGKGNDTIDGRGGNDTLFGGEGQDILFGGPGNDFLFGNAGEDVINAGEGDDLLFGGKGNDTLFGNEGNDFLSGDLGNDVLFGGPGNDRFALQSNGGLDFVGDFTIGQDLIVLTEGLQFNQLAISQVGANTLIRLAGTSQDLMVLGGITATALTQASFIPG